ncbi:MAG: SIS domain-containing protein [Spirochaetaceae bacterium]|jgi:D-sedoheptulose 7-phosphate isomerase|nr:SIS domain-containing protein [Spirochaetaceae bacterium]
MENPANRIKELIERYPRLAECEDSVYKAYKTLEASYEAGGKLLIAGNGGSSADADHITGELMKGFVKKRPPSDEFYMTLSKIADAETAAYIAQNLQCGLPAINLANHSALITASINDIDGKIIYAQQVYAYGTAGDAFLGISTSGNSENVCLAMLTAKARGLKTIALTGVSGGRAAKIADVAIKAPETETYKAQELHLPVYHCICLMLEERFF